MLTSSISTGPFIYSRNKCCCCTTSWECCGIATRSKISAFFLLKKLPGSQLLFYTKAKSADHIITLSSTYSRNKCCCCTTSWKCCGIASAVILVIVGAIIGGGFLYLHVLKSRLDFLPILFSVGKKIVKWLSFSTVLCVLTRKIAVVCTQYWKNCRVISLILQLVFLVKSPEVKNFLEPAMFCHLAVLI